MAVDTVGVKYTADLADLQKAHDQLLKENLALQAANDKTQKGINDNSKKTVGIVNQLIEKEKALVAARNRSTNPVAIERFNRLIEETRAETTKLTASTQAYIVSLKALKKEQEGGTMTMKGMGKEMLKSFTMFSVMSAGADLLKNAISGAVKSQKEFQSSLSNLQAITGASTEDLKFYSEAAKSAAMEHGVMAKDVVEAYKLIGGAKPELLENKEALAEVTEQAIILSKASGLDLPESAKRLTDAMNQFGAPAADAGKFINILAEASKLGAAEVPQLTDAVLLSGSAARAANVSFAENAAILEAFADKGLKGAEAGTQLRNVMLKMTAVDTLPKNAIDALDKAGVNMKVLSDTTQPLKVRLEELAKIQGNSTAIVETFGLENFNAASILIDQRARVDELSIALGKDGLTTAMDQAKINTNNLAGSSDKLAATWDAIIQGEGGISGFFKTIVDGAISALVGIDRFTNASKYALEMFAKDTEQALATTRDAAKNWSDQELKDVMAFQQEKQNLLGEQYRKAQQAGDEAAAEALAKQIVDSANIMKGYTKLLEERTKVVDEDVKVTEVGANTTTKINKKAIDEKLKAEQEYQKLLIENMKEGRGKELAELEFKYQQEREKLKGNHKALEQLEIAHQKEQLAIIKKYRTEQIQGPDVVTPESVRKDQKKITSEREKEEKERIEKTNKIQEAELENYKKKKEKQKEDEEKEEKDLQQAREEIINTAIDASFQIANNSRQAKLDKELSALDKQREAELSNIKLTEQQRLEIETKFAQQEAELKKKAAQKDKTAAIIQATINGALAVTKLLATPPLAVAAGIAAAAQIAIIAAQPIPEFAKGVIDLQGPGTGTSDSIHAKLSKGESVTTAVRTKQYKAELQAIRNGKLDEFIYTNHVLPVIRQVVERRETAANMANSFMLQNMFDDTGIVRAIKSQQPATSKDIKELGKTLSNTMKDAAYVQSKMWKA